MSVRNRETISSSRSGDAYNAHSYHTKVPPHAIATLIKRHLPTGGTIADPFCGSGSTGIAAAIAERSLPPTAHYDVLLGDLSPYATFIAQGLNGAPDADIFERSVRRCLKLARDEIAALWSTRHSDGRHGEILYTVWSELLICPRCESAKRFWDLAVDLENGGIRRMLACGCGHEYRKDRGERVTECVADPFIGEPIERVVREPVVITYEVDGRRYEKTPDDEDRATLDRATSLTPPAACPRRRMLDRTGPWGDLYRSGYHRGVTHVHHFYTPRSFLTIGHLWQAAERTEAQEAVRLLISSYNLAHATLMSRLVFKRGSAKPVLTGYQTGALYISSLPVEKNPLRGVEAKRRALTRAFEVVRQRRGTVYVKTAAAQDWNELPVGIDYAFVDPPFGANIPYAEANFIAEAWLGRFTDQAAEAAMSRSQQKSAGDYRALLAAGFEALRTRLRRGGGMTVMFHSAASEPWNALTGALRDAGWQTDSVLVLDKRQASFKQVRTRGAVQGDLLIEVSPRTGRTSRAHHRDPHLRGWLQDALGHRHMPLDTETERRLFSRYVAEQVERGARLQTSAAQFYAAARALTVTSEPAAGT